MILISTTFIVAFLC